MTNIFNTCSAKFTLPVLAVCWFAVAAPVHAATYTWQGNTFSSEEEMHEYIREYMRVWMELRGESATPSSTKATTVKSSTSASGVTVRTDNADTITASGARVTGRFTRNGSGVITVWFEYGTNASSLWFASTRETLRSDYGSASYDRVINNLLQDTTYYYRAVAQDANGRRSYGTVRTFTTTADPRNTDSGIRVSTSWARDVREDRATLTGSVRFSSSASGFVWFEYGDSADDLYNRTPATYVAKSSNTPSITYLARGLKERTTYYFRMVGYDANKVKNFGTIQRFTTIRDIVNEKPKVTTGRVSEITASDAILSGSVRMNDFRNGKVFFVYGEDQAAVRAAGQYANTYKRINQRGDSLQKRLVDAELDRDGTYTLTIDGLDQQTTIYAACGVEYENEYDDDVILLGSVTSFKTKAL